MKIEFYYFDKLSSPVFCVSGNRESFIPRVKDKVNHDTLGLVGYVTSIEMCYNKGQYSTPEESTLQVVKVVYE